MSNPLTDISTEALNSLEDHLSDIINTLGDIDDYCCEFFQWENSDQNDLNDLYERTKLVRLKVRKELHRREDDILNG